MRGVVERPLTVKIVKCLVIIMAAGERIGCWWKGEYDPRPIYYVYEWFNTETGEVFYVGKGTGDRYKTKANTKRNRYFVRYVHAHECDVRFVKENLTEKEAFDLEVETIAKYKEIGQCTCNFATGGGNPSAHLSGELNPMYGKTHPPEIREILRQVNLGGRNAGENNSQYGIPLRDRMSEEQYQHWIEVHRQKYQGAGNPKARKVNMRYADTGEIFKTFDCIKDCVLYLREIFPEFNDRKHDNFRRFPEVHCTPKKAYKNFYFEIIRPNKDNTVPSSEKGEGVTTNESVSEEKNPESK